MAKKDSAKLIAALNPPRVADDNRRIRYRGKNTPLGLCAFWVTVFEANEALPKTKKLTDEAIKLLVLQEFPESKAAQSLSKHPSEGGKVVNHYRNLYNRGLFTKGEVPAIQSYRYDLDGNRDLSYKRKARPSA